MSTIRVLADIHVSVREVPMVGTQLLFYWQAACSVLADWWLVSSNRGTEHNRNIAAQLGGSWGFSSLPCMHAGGCGLDWSVDMLPALRAENPLFICDCSYRAYGELVFPACVIGQSVCTLVCCAPQEFT
jgi:hypothetical protein